MAPAENTEDENRIQDLISQMTLAEKVSMTSGSGMWYSTGVERLGIPRLKVTDGPNGARGESREGATSACFPCGTALAATWNTQLVHAVGAEIGNETKSKGAHILLGPTVNIHRTPLAGRNFECYSEDPFLSARVAAAFISGVNSRGVGTSVKHFVCNDSEFERMTISSEVGERALREIYLPPFEAAVREAGTWSIMSAYNRVNGTYASESPDLLTQILRDEWGFDGFVVSDWFGTKSTAACAAGLDLEMPGPGVHLGEKILAAVESGDIPEEAVNNAVRRILRITVRAGVFENPDEVKEHSIDRPEQRALVRRAAAEALVLLRNEDVLPLEASKLKRIAVIGPNADPAVIQGGGSAQVGPHYSVSPLDGIRERLGDAVEVVHEIGCTIHKSLPSLDSRWVTTPDGEPGLEVAYFNGIEPGAEPDLVRRGSDGAYHWFAPFADEIDIKAFSARLTAHFTPPESGLFQFALTSAGLTRLRIDGETLIDNWAEQTPGDFFFGMGSSEVRGEIQLEAGRNYLLEVDYSRQDTPLIAGLKIGCMQPVAEDGMERAVKAAANADAAVVVIGLNEEWESEGRDRESLGLPGRQDELVRRIVAANPQTVVVVNAGSPVQMDWAHETPALLQFWYPGHEGGNALADVLFGDLSPSGRLPTTFPVRIEDNPTHVGYPGESGQVVYGEGVFVGYRYYEHKKIEPLFPFGHGLGYARFEYGPLQLNQKEYKQGEDLKVSLDVTNTSTREAQEVVQLYVHDVESTRLRPEQELKAFTKLLLAPGETQRITLAIGAEALASFDTEQKAWVAEPGEFEIRVGASSQDIRQRAGLQLTDA
jgi:beta-glucosidase